MLVQKLGCGVHGQIEGRLSEGRQQLAVGCRVRGGWKEGRSRYEASSGLSRGTEP